MIPVRELLPGEWALLREARLDVLLDSPEAFHSRREFEAAMSEQEWRSRLAARSWFVALDDGRPCGLSSGGTFEPDDPDWMLRSMWVAPHLRGRGVAEDLLRAVADDARSSGAPALVLWVYQSNERAVAFYRRMGFAATGTTADDDGVPVRRRELMRLSLGAELRWTGARASDECRSAAGA